MLPHVSFNQVTSVEKEINQSSKNKLLDLINSAKKQICIAMMVWTDQELAKAVINAKNRGVDVDVIMNDLDTVALQLQKEGVKIVINPKLSFMHNKFMWVDDQILMNGSANWSKSSFSRNDESFIILRNLDPAQVKQLKDYWGHLMEVS